MPEPIRTAEPPLGINAELNPAASRIKDHGIRARRGRAAKASPRAGGSCFVSVVHRQCRPTEDGSTWVWLLWFPTLAPERRRKDGARSFCFFLTGAIAVAGCVTHSAPNLPGLGKLDFAYTGSVRLGWAPRGNEEEGGPPSVPGTDRPIQNQKAKSWH